MEETRYRQLDRKKKIIFPLVTAGLFLFIIVLCWLGWAAYRGSALYRHIRTGRSIFYSRFYKSDPEMGYAYFREGRDPIDAVDNPDIVERRRRHLVPEPSETPAPSRPLVLALGGSFTYGSGCHAEETYPYLVGAGLNGSSINAGLSFGSLAQMLLLARRLIPKYKPDFVLVQYSPWLVRRAASPFTGTDIFKIPTPYFADVPGGNVILLPPLYESKFFSIPRKYRDAESPSDYIPFLSKVGMPIYIHQDIRMLKYHVKRLAGITAPPGKNYVKIVESVYSEIDEICRENGAEMIIVMMGVVDKPKQAAMEAELEFDKFPEPEVEKLYEIKGVVAVDTMPPLLEKLDKKDYESYSRAYHHWRGSPPVCYDQHPNPSAHEIIAGEILKAIEAGK